MERFLGRYEKDCMKMAMVKHEETFRQQVNELHRLYQVQKLLVRQLEESSRRKQQDKHAGNEGGTQRCHGTKMEPQGHCVPWKRPFDLELPAEEYIEEAERNDSTGNERESDVELTLSIGGGRRRHKDAMLLTSDFESFSSSATESDGGNRKFHRWGLSHLLNMKNTCHPAAAGGGNATSTGPFDVKEARKRDVIDPSAPWRKCLNMT